MSQPGLESRRRLRTVSARNRTRRTSLGVHYVQGVITRLSDERRGRREREKVREVCTRAFHLTPNAGWVLESCQKPLQISRSSAQAWQTENAFNGSPLSRCRFNVSTCPFFFFLSSTSLASWSVAQSQKASKLPSAGIHSAPVGPRSAHERVRISSPCSELLFLIHLALDSWSTAKVKKRSEEIRASLLDVEQNLTYRTVMDTMDRVILEWIKESDGIVCGSLRRERNKTLRAAALEGNNQRQDDGMKRSNSQHNYADSFHFLHHSCHSSTSFMHGRMTRCHFYPLLFTL